MEHVGFLSDGDCQEPAVRRLHLPLPKFNVDPDVTTLDRYGSTRAPSIHLLSISTAVLFCCSSRPYYSAADSIVRHASMEDFRTSCHGNPRRWRCMWSPEIIRYQQRNDNQWVHSQTLQKKTFYASALLRLLPLCLWTIVSRTCSSPFLKQASH